jgi:hypothetical protein
MMSAVMDRDITTADSTHPLMETGTINIIVPSTASEAKLKGYATAKNSMNENLDSNFEMASMDNPGAKMNTNRYRNAFTASIYSFATCKIRRKMLAETNKKYGNVPFSFILTLILNL